MPGAFRPKRPNRNPAAQLPRGPGLIRKSLSGKRIKAKGMPSGRAIGPLQSIKSDSALRKERIKSIARESLKRKKAT